MISIKILAVSTWAGCLPSASAVIMLGLMTSAWQIEERVRSLLAKLPPGVTLLAAVKGRSPDQVQAVLRAGIRHLGHNYVQEAASSWQQLGRVGACWHLIGHLQRNKVKRALELFDQIDTVDSERLAQELDRACAATGRRLDVLIEVNSAREENKTGADPLEVPRLARSIDSLQHLRLCGLFTMGPFGPDRERLRQAFRLTRGLFDELKVGRPDFIQLSMGMSDSWELALEEGANVIRLGTALFGPRPT